MTFFHEKFTKLADLYAAEIANHSYEKQVDFDCYKNLIDHFETECGKFTDNSLKYTKNLHAMCQDSNIVVESARMNITEICKTEF